MSAIWQATLQYSAVDGASSVSNRVSRNVGRNNGKIKGTFTSLRRAAARTAKQVNSAFGQISAASMAGSAALIAFGAKSITETTMKVDSFKNQMLIATGSIQGMNDEWEKAKDIANTTGAALDVVTDTYGKFSVAAKSAGMETEQMTKIYSELVKGTVAVGLSQEQVKLALKAVEQMMSKGTVMSEELKSQFGEQIPDAMGLAARSMGVTVKELMKMMEKGELMADDLLPKLARQMGEEWGTASKRGAAQVRASMNRLGTAFTELKVVMDDLFVGEQVQKFVEFATEKLKQFTNYLNTDFRLAIEKMKLYFALDSAHREYIMLSYKQIFEDVKYEASKLYNWFLDTFGIMGLIGIAVFGKLRVLEKSKKIISKYFDGIKKFWKAKFDELGAYIRGASKAEIASLAALSAVAVQEVNKPFTDAAKVNIDVPIDYTSRIKDAAFWKEVEAQNSRLMNFEYTPEGQSALKYHDLSAEQEKMFYDQLGGAETFQKKVKVSPTYDYKTKDPFDEHLKVKERYKASAEANLAIETDIYSKELQMMSDKEVAKYMEKTKWNDLAAGQQEELNKRLLSIDTKYLEKEKKAKEKEKEKKIAAEKEVFQAKMDIGSASMQLVGQLASMQDRTKKKGFENWKKLATVQAIGNTALAVTSALGMVPFTPLNFALAGLVGAMGMLEVAQIQKAQFQPRMGGGNVYAGQQYQVGERGRELFVPNQNGRIYPNDVLDKGSKNVTAVQPQKDITVNLSIQAADSQDMDRLIMDRMPLIVNGIRRGMA